MEMIRTKEELLAYLEKIHYNKPNSNYRIALEALIFTPEGKILLEKRGPQAQDEVGKLEGVGGGLGEHYDLHDALYYKIKGEIGEDAKVEIDRLLEIRPVQFEEVDKEELQEWVVVSYLCRLIEGEPINARPSKIADLQYLTLDELYAKSDEALSRSTVGARKVYQAQFGNRPYYEKPEYIQ